MADEAAAQRTRRVTRQQAKSMRKAAEHEAEDTRPEAKQVPTGPKVIDLSSDSDDEEVLSGHGENPLRPYESDESDDSDDEVIQRRQETVSPERSRDNSLVQDMASMSVSPVMEEGGTSSSLPSQSGTQGWQRSPSTGLTGYDVPVCKHPAGGKSDRSTPSPPHRYLTPGRHLVDMPDARFGRSGRRLRDTQEEAEQRQRARDTRATWIMEIVGCCRIVAEDAVKGMDWSFERALGHTFYLHRVYMALAAVDMPPVAGAAAEHKVEPPSPEPVEATVVEEPDLQGDRTGAWILSSGGRSRPAWMSDSETESEEADGGKVFSDLETPRAGKRPRSSSGSSSPGFGVVSVRGVPPESMPVSPSGVNVGQFVQAGHTEGLVSPVPASRPRGILEQLGLAGSQPEGYSDVSTEEYEKPPFDPLPQAGNSTNVSGAPEQEVNGVKRFKAKVDELAIRLPLPVDPAISWDNLTGSDEKTVTDDSGVDFESPEPGGRAVVPDVDTGSDLSPAMQGRLAGKGTGGYLSSRQGRMMRTLT